MKNKKILTTILSIFLLPIISAYSWGGYSPGPLYYLENTWVIFSLIFLLFFAIIFYTVNKSFKNRAVSALIAGAISLIISMIMTQRGLMQDYGYGELSSWVLLIAIGIGIAFLIRFATQNFGMTGAITTVILLWIFLQFYEPYNLFPSSLATNYTFREFYETWIKGIIGLIALIFIAIVASAKKGPKTVWSEVSDLFGKSVNS